MNDRIKASFGRIRTEEAIKEDTRAFIAKKTKGYTRSGETKRSFCACGAVFACLVLLLLGGYWLYFTPAFEISIDINPSVELGVNRFDRVISVNGFNEDGRALARTLDVNFMDYGEAVELVLQNEKISSLLSDNEVMSITVTGPDEGQTAEILSRLEECTSRQDGSAHCYYFSSEEAEGAHGAGLSCGRYRLYLELKALGSDITPEEIREMSISRIEALIAILSEEGGETQAGTGTGHGHHHHHGG